MTIVWNTRLAAERAQYNRRLRLKNRIKICKPQASSCKRLKKEIIKEDLDQSNKLTQKEWDKFVEIYSDTFSKQTIDLADKLFWEYQNNDLKYSSTLKKT